MLYGNTNLRRKHGLDWFTNTQKIKYNFFHRKIETLLQKNAIHTEYNLLLDLPLIINCRTQIQSKLNNRNLSNKLDNLDEDVKRHVTRHYELSALGEEAVDNALQSAGSHSVALTPDANHVHPAQAKQALLNNQHTLIIRNLQA